MLQVPLTANPSQTLSIVLANQNAQIAVRQLGVGDDAHLYFDLQLNGVPVVTSRICRNEQRLLVDAGYQGFVGDFMFFDTQGDTDPVYTGLNARYVLMYLEAGDIPP